MNWLVWIMICVTVISLGGMVLGNLDGRRKHKLELHKEDRRRIEAQTKQIEAQHKQAELEYRKAQQELERFDRRTAQLPGLAPSDPAEPRGG